MFLSIIISTHNRLPYLKALLCNLQNLKLPDDAEVLIMADNCTDGTNAYLKDSHFNINFSFEIVHESSNVLARNQGIKSSRGDYIILVNDDIIFTKNYFEFLRYSLLKNPNHIHSGNIYSVQLNSNLQIMEVVSKTKEINWTVLEKNVGSSNFLNDIPRVIFREEPYNSINDQIDCWWALVTSGNMCMHRRTIKDVGLFDQNLKNLGAHELDFCYRAFKKGYKWKFNKNCMLYQLNNNRDENSIVDCVINSTISCYKKHGMPKEIQAMISFLTNVISIDEFNSICTEGLGLWPIELDDYFLNLKSGLKMNQSIRRERKSMRQLSRS